MNPNSNRPNVPNNMKKNPMQGPFKYLLLLVLLAVIAFALSNQNGNISNEKSYSELLTMIEEGQIEQVAIQSNTLVARLVGSKVPQDAFPSRYDINVQLPSTDTFYTNVNAIYADKLGKDASAVTPRDYDFTIEVLAPATAAWWLDFIPLIVTVLLFIVAWYFIMRQQTGGNKGVMNFGKSRARMTDPEKNTSKDESNGLDAEGAAVIVMKVKTGEILACASYPTYNLATMNQDWAEIEADPLKPFFNRAFGANYAPGSTFKMCTLIAAMEHRSTNPKSEFFGRYLYLPGEIIRDQGVFTKYPGFSPTCLIWTSNPGVTHGDLTAQRALEVSCNYFFYELGSRMTIEMLNETANGLGLGVPTGIELTEKVGWVTDEASKKAAYGETGVNSQITAGDRVLAAIGQAENRFSPLQLCIYASTLANKGTRMKATFLSRVVASDYIKENSPEIMSQMEIASTTDNTYIEGMRLVIAGGEGTARSHFGGPKDLDTFPVKVCGKTGTAQHSSGGSDHGAFICFAPMEDPEVAVAVYGEKAAHGATLAAVAEDILRAYFAMEAASEVNAFENQAS